MTTGVMGQDIAAKAEAVIAQPPPGSSHSNGPHNNGSGSRLYSRRQSPVADYAPDPRSFVGPPAAGSHSSASGFVKLLGLRRLSGKRVPLPGPTHPLGSSLRACHFGPTLESIPHLCAV
jgi:hypothetical protein